MVAAAVGQRMLCGMVWGSMRETKYRVARGVSIGSVWKEEVACRNGWVYVTEESRRVRNVTQRGWSKWI